MRIRICSPKRLAGAVIGTLIGVAALVAPVQTVQASGAVLLNESFTDASVASSYWTVGGTGFTPCLTASIDTTQTPVPGCGTNKVGLPAGGDPAGSGALRLTDNAAFTSGFILDNEQLPTQAGLVVSFDQYQYDGTGADGLSFFLANGAYNLTAPGMVGGYLGYAGGNQGIGDGNGVANGLFGVGLDAYGNYSNFTNSGCTGNPSFTPNQVGVRGPGNLQTGYCWLGGTGALTTPLHVDSATSRTAAGVQLAVQITVDPPTAINPQIRVSLNGHNVLTVPEPANLPPTFKFGFASSTGGANDIHELNNLQVSTVDPLTPSWDLSGSTTGAFTAGSVADYSFTAAADPNWGPAPDPVTVTDTLAGGATVASLPSGTGWVCSATVIGSSTATCTYTPGGSLPAGNALPVLSVPAQLPTATGPIVNSAVVTAADNYPADTQTTVTTTKVVVPGTTPVTASIPINTSYQQAVATPVGTGPFTYRLASTPPSSFGTATLDPVTGLLSFTPNVNVSGVVPTFDFQVADGHGNLSPATPVNLTVTPVAHALSIAGDGPGPLSATPVPALGSAPFTYALVAGSLPSSVDGTAAIDAATGTVTFTPASGFHGTVPTFDYLATDQYGAVAPEEPVTVTVNKPPPPGGLRNLHLSTELATPVTDTPPAPSGAGPLTWQLVGPPSPAYGVVSIDPSSGEISFTPAANFSGAVPQFQYQVTDQYGQSDLANVNLVVQPLTSALGVTANGPTPLSTGVPVTQGSGRFSYQLLALPPASDGTASIDSSTGVVTFTPARGFLGTVPTFDYAATDAFGVQSPAAAVNVVVTAPPAPTATDVTRSISANNSLSFALPAPAGAGPFTWKLLSRPPENDGTASLSPTTGLLTFIPAENWSGLVPAFTYQVQDQYLQASNGASVSLEVSPQAANLTAATTLGDPPLNLQPPSPVGVGPFTYGLVTGSLPSAGVGTLTIDPGTGLIVFTPATGVSGVVPTFQYSVTDAAGTQVYASVNLTVLPRAIGGVSQITPGKGRYQLALLKAEGSGPFSCLLVAVSLPKKRIGAIGLNQHTCVATFVPVPGLSRTAFHIRFAVKDKNGLVSPPALHAVEVGAAYPARQTASGHCACGFWWIPFLVAGILAGWFSMVYWLRRRYGDQAEEK
ncbi:MAG TPA: tandem-95 repeat protein [Candidatus Acidoferrales bacterium]|nr:tandem-95 repeat protein [Candidatus Acidoferrales bacterium]